MVKLDVGCGLYCAAGYLGVDKRELEGVVQHDIEVIPWPFKDDYADEIRMHHVMEHICPKKTIDVMNEMWRVLKIGGVLNLNMPLGDTFSYIQDPTHCNQWNQLTPEYFCPGSPSRAWEQIYRPKPWKADIKIDGSILIVVFTKIEESNG